MVAAMQMRHHEVRSTLTTTNRTQGLAEHSIRFNVITKMLKNPEVMKAQRISNKNDVLVSVTVINRKKKYFYSVLHFKYIWGCFLESLLYKETFQASTHSGEVGSFYEEYCCIEGRSNQTFLRTEFSQAKGPYELHPIVLKELSND